MTVLLLAGTGEGKALAKALAAAHIPAIASLAGATRAPDTMDLPTRVGGFGGGEAFRSCLAENEIRAVVDATHPFATRITQRTCEICRDLDLPYLHVLRPAWEPVPGDRWHFIDAEEDAVKLISPGQTVFLGTGRQTLEKFANLAGCRVICRQIDPPTGPFPFPGGEFLIGRPPFPVVDEIILFERLGVDWLVVKNAGGEASRTKLTAARAKQIPVIMINRPPMPDADRVETVDDAMTWVSRL